MLVALNLFCLFACKAILLNFGVVGAASGSGSSYWRSLAFDTPGDSQGSQIVEGLVKCKNRMREMERWWDSKYSSSVPDFDMSEINRRIPPWLGFGPSEKIKRWDTTRYLRSIEFNPLCMLYFLFKLKVPMSGSNKKVSYISQSPVSKKLVVSFVANRICGIRSGVIWESRGSDRPEDEDIDNLFKAAVFSEDETTGRCIIRFAVKVVYDEKESIFVLGLFLTLLFRRMEFEGEAFDFCDFEGEGTSGFWRGKEFSDDGFKARWETTDRLRKNCNGAYIGLTGIPVRCESLLTEVAREMRPQDTHYSNKIIKDFAEGFITAQTIKAEFLLFKKVFAQVGRVFVEKNYYAYCWAVFAFYDDELLRATDFAKNSSGKSAPDWDMSEESSFLLTKYVIISTRLFGFLQSYDQDPGMKYDDGCTTQ
ncbi:hypothetical protein PAEPH01_0202 [Pancytospora epiphaga]|nr:hypothetical protein PAEPH01_0202 [Pancytospora epiphaga]